VPATGTQHTLSNRLIIELLSDLDLPSPTLLVPAAASKDRTLVDAVCGYHPTPPLRELYGFSREEKCRGRPTRGPQHRMLVRSVMC
jgi:hypothetical protein